MALAVEKEETETKRVDILPPVNPAFWQSYAPVGGDAEENGPIRVVEVDDVFESVLQRNGHSVDKKNGHSKQPSNGSVQPPQVQLSDSKSHLNGEAPYFAALAVPGADPEAQVHEIQDEPPEGPPDQDETSPSVPVRKLWKRRHARSIQEGIRRESTHQLSSLLKKAKETTSQTNRRYAAKTISGFINALAEEADDLEVQVNSRPDTPFWDKHIDSIRINFSRLGFKPLRMGGLGEAIRSMEDKMDPSHKDQLAENLELEAVLDPDEAFDRIDVDKSGALDPDEIAQALTMAAYDLGDEKELLEGLASELVELYDANGDGVVDREEYRALVEDMAALRQAEQQKQETDGGWASLFGKTIRTFLRRNNEAPESVDEAPESVAEKKEPANATAQVEPLSDTTSDALIQSVAKGAGTILFSNLRLDLRQLLFGWPLLKRITPGGPLILEPFKATVTASFSKEDISDSFLLDAALRRLIARALRRRVRSFRDFMDGAVFYGRKWNMASKSAPVVEVPQLTSIEFDPQDRLVVTGIAQVCTNPGAPLIENKFKVRTKIGTNKKGRLIRLVEPELALVIECPKAWERNIVSACKNFNMTVPTRPDPIYSFIPLYSPLKLDDDDDGFDLGEDNCIEHIGVKNDALRFEMSAVLRPGRFLGNHYLAFTVPQRTFIITMDRVRNGIREARKNKRARQAAEQEVASAVREEKGKVYRQAHAQALSQHEEELVPEDDLKFAEHKSKKDKVVAPPSNGKKSFFSRFIEGYTEFGKEGNESSERLTIAISDWFGRQGGNGDPNTSKGEQPRRSQEV